METPTRDQLSQAFTESFGNQGAPVVDEILENFSNSVMSIVCDDQVLIELFLELEWLKIDTVAELKVHLHCQNIQHTSRENFLHSDVEWKIDGVEYRVCASEDGEIFIRGFEYRDRGGKIRVWYTQNYYAKYRIAAVYIKGIEIYTNLKSEGERLFGPFPV